MSRKRMSSTSNCVRTARGMHKIGSDPCNKTGSDPCYFWLRSLHQLRPDGVARGMHKIGSDPCNKTGSDPCYFWLRQVAGGLGGG